LLVGLALASALAAVAFYRSKPTYYVAYVGRYQRAGSSFDDLHERALRKYLDELNEGLDDFRLDLKTFSIKTGPDQFDPRPVYEEIAREKDVVVVVDNTWGSDISSVADDLIKAKGIPVVSINADKLHTDYSGNVIFIGYDDDVPEKVAKFSEKVLENKEVIFITEESYGLTKLYEEQLALSGITYKNKRLSVQTPKWNLVEEQTLLNSLDALLAELQRSEASPTVVLNVHSNWGGPVIKHVDTHYRNVTLLGGPYVIPSVPDYVFGSNENGNRLIMFTYPHDAVTNRVLNDLASVQGENSSISSIPNAPLFVKRCLDAVSVIGSVVESPERKTVSRGDFLNFFHEKLARGAKVVGYDDVYLFDQSLLLADGRSFEERSREGESSYMYQLNRDGDRIPNLYFGIDHIVISNVNLKAQTFHANFILWVTPNPQGDDIFDNIIIFRNQVGLLDHKLLHVADAPEPSAYYSMSGDFSMDVDVTRYPFDSQELRMELQIVNHMADKLHISFVHEHDADSISLNDSEWDKEGVRVTTDNVIVSSPGGGASREGERVQKIKLTNLRIKISRQPSGAIFTIIVPLVLMGLVAVALLFVNDGSFASVGNVCASMFLGMVAYALVFVQMTPRTNAMTIADKLFYATFIMVLLIFLKAVVFNSSIAGRESGKRVVSYMNDKALLIGGGVAAGYLLLMAGIVFFGLRG
jgi:hypothetical protein